MNTNLISQEEISALKIENLPTRPTAPEYFGGLGYSARDMKAAFDRLPLFIIEVLNSLIEDVKSLEERIEALEQ